MTDETIKNVLDDYYKSITLECPVCNKKTHNSEDVICRNTIVPSNEYEKLPKPGIVPEFQCQIIFKDNDAEIKERASIGMCRDCFEKYLKQVYDKKICKVYRRHSKQLRVGNTTYSAIEEGHEPEDMLMQEELSDKLLDEIKLMSPEAAMRLSDKIRGRK